jgi:dihydrofolate reductase
MILSHVVAASTNNAIGKDNQLLWHLPNDLKFFKNITGQCPLQWAENLLKRWAINL